MPLERFGAVTTRTLTLEPREGHFTLKEDWGLGEFPEMLRLYGKALHKVDAGWLNAFGWSNIGIDALLRRVLRPDREPQPDRVAWAASRPTRSSS